MYKIEITKGNQKEIIEGVSFNSATVAALWIAVASSMPNFAGVRMEWVPCSK